jgi:hypothetical protein
MGDPRPACGHLSDASARYCPQCGRPLTPAAPEWDITEWVKAGWALFLRDLPMAIGVSLLWVVPVIVFVVFGYFGTFGVAILADAGTDAPRALALLLGAILALLVVGMSVAVPALQAGVYACFLEGIRTGRLSPDKVWAGFRNWWACTWVSGTLWSVVLLCLPLMFILVGIPIAVGIVSLLWLALFRIVDTGRGGMEALSFAWGVMRDRLWLMLVYTLLVMVVMEAGVMCMYIGVVVTVPIGIAALAAAYDSVKREREPLHDQR